MTHPEHEKFQITIQKHCFDLLDATQCYFDSGSETDFKDMMRCADFLFDNFLGPSVLYLDLRHPHTTTEFVNGEYQSQTFIAGGIAKRARNDFETKSPRQRLIEPEDLPSDIPLFEVMTLEQIDHYAQQYFGRDWKSFL